jgi:hypothetical protein
MSSISERQVQSEPSPRWIFVVYGLGKDERQDIRESLT